jgi:hypothetical protein
MSLNGETKRGALGLPFFISSSRAVNWLLEIFS